MSSGISHIFAGLHASKWRMVFSGHVDEGEPTPRAMSSAIARPRVVRCTDCTVLTVRDLLYCIVHQPAANTGRAFVVQPALQDEPRHPRGLWGQVSQKSGRKPTNLAGQTDFKYPVASELSHGNRPGRRRGPTPRTPGPVAKSSASPTTSQGCPVPGGSPGLEDGRRARLRGANSTQLFLLSKPKLNKKRPSIEAGSGQKSSMPYGKWQSGHSL